jgi:glycosyltransferase involved in cell wall biosynthesis
LFVSLRLIREVQAALLPGSGVDLDHFAPATKSGGSEDFVFLVPSRLIREKGIAEFCAAAVALREVRPHVRFQLLGPIEPASNKSAITREQIAQWEHECGIEYLGSTDDVRPFFAKSDCVVLPSYYPEGTPRALIEAAAMGKPIITTDTPGCRDLVAPGETGFLCEPQSAESLVDAMDEMLKLPGRERLAMGRAGRRKAEREYDERTVIAAYLAELQSVVDCARR